VTLSFDYRDLIQCMHGREQLRIEENSLRAKRFLLRREVLSQYLSIYFYISLSLSLFIYININEYIYTVADWGEFAAGEAFPTTTRGALIISIYHSIHMSISLSLFIYIYINEYVYTVAGRGELAAREAIPTTARGALLLYIYICICMYIYVYMRIYIKRFTLK